MAEIRFDVGKNIVETAKASGVPEFASDDVNGSISYSVADIPREVEARFVRPGLEIAWSPLFAFTMYTNRRRDPSMAVYKAQLQLRTHLQTDAQAQGFAETTIAQFQKGKWRRWADPVWHVLLTGRSSVLDESGALEVSSAGGTGAPDPGYRLSAAEWLALAGDGLYYRWSGDNVLATLSINNSPGVDRKPAYRMGLEFEVLDVSLKRDAENQAQELKEGDAKGWGSTAEYEANKIKRAEQIKRLIANAIKRGDSVVPPQ